MEKHKRITGDGNILVKETKHGISLSMRKTVSAAGSSGSIDLIPCKITANDYEDERYSFAEQTEAIDEESKVTYTDKSGGITGTVTNIAEIGQSSHTLDTGDIIYVWQKSIDDTTAYFCNETIIPWVTERYMYVTNCLNVDGCPSGQWRKVTLAIREETIESPDTCGS